MEMAGLGEGVQLVNVMINGASQVFALTGHFASYSIEMMIRMFKAIHASRIEHEQKKKILKPGEILPDQLISHVSDMNLKAHSNIVSTSIMQIDDEIVGDFEKYAESNNLSYAKLYDLNAADGKTEIMYSSEHAQLVGAFIQENSPHARAYTMDNYLGNATVEDISRLENLVNGDSRVKEGVKALETAGSSGPVYSLDEFSSFCNNYYVAYMSAEDRENFLSFAASNDIKCAPLEQTQWEGSCVAVNLNDCAKLSQSGLYYSLIDADYFYQHNKDYYRSNGIYNDRQLAFMKGIARHGYARESEDYFGDTISIPIDDEVMKDMRNESSTSISLLIHEYEDSGNKVFAKIPRGDIIAAEEGNKILLRENINYSLFKVGKDENGNRTKEPVDFRSGKQIFEAREKYKNLVKNNPKQDAVKLVMTGKDGKKITGGTYSKKETGLVQSFDEAKKAIERSKGLSK